MNALKALYVMQSMQARADSKYRVLKEVSDNENLLRQIEEIKTLELLVAQNIRSALENTEVNI